jgi:Domain of unknown function (DUF1330)
MKAYAIAAETIKDKAMFDTYRNEVPATLVPFGGQFIVRGGNLTVLEGEWPHPRLVIIDVALKAPCSLVQTGSLRAVLYSGDILRPSRIDSDDERTRSGYSQTLSLFLSVQGALSVARSPEVSRFGSFVEPTADWF